MEESCLSTGNSNEIKQYSGIEECIEKLMKGRLSVQLANSLIESKDKD